MISAKAVLVYRIILHGNKSSTASFDGVELFPFYLLTSINFPLLVHWEKYAPNHFIRICIIPKSVIVNFCIITVCNFFRMLY